jgi:uncharacterized membrane protein
MTTDPYSDPPRRGFPWKTTAIAAMALNLLLIGAGVGALAAGARLTPPGAPGMGGGGGAMTRSVLESLPQAKRDEVRRALGSGMKAAAPERRAAREARIAAFQAAMAEPYDAVAVRAAFAKMRAADVATLGKFDDSLVGVLGQLTPQERRAAMIELARRAQKGRGGLRPEGPRGDRPGPDRPGPDQPPPP